jgi:hypothetical protein
MDDAGGRASSSVAIQGTGTSPRRTRSGKAVKYQEE